jgi:drug/metabolite transporter (DMT)-like permease
MTHRLAVGVFVVATFLWAIAGPIVKQLDSASGFEVTMWRSVFAAFTVWIISWWRGAGSIVAQIKAGGRYAIISGIMWSIMFCCFMIALTLTTPANVLLVQCIGPVLTAMLSRLVFKQPIVFRTWVVIVVACTAIATIYIKDVSSLAGHHTLGVLVALGIPCAAAINWVVQQKATQSASQRLDLTSAVMLGAVISACVMLPLALPLQASVKDVSMLAFLGVFQLGLPCVMVVMVMNRLPAHEASLLGLLEVVFGIMLTWLASGDRPGLVTIVCGAIVIFTLTMNELVGAREQRT